MWFCNVKFSKIGKTITLEWHPWSHFWFIKFTHTKIQRRKCLRKNKITLSTFYYRNRTSKQHNFKTLIKKKHIEADFKKKTSWNGNLPHPLIEDENVSRLVKTRNPRIKSTSGKHIIKFFLNYTETCTKTKVALAKVLLLYSVHQTCGCAETVGDLL